MTHAMESEIDRNFDYFQRNLATYVQTFRGKFALMRNAAVVQFHDSVVDAEASGVRQFSDGIFSIQEVSINRWIQAFSLMPLIKGMPDNRRALVGVSVQST